MFMIDDPAACLTIDGPRLWEIDVIMAVLHTEAILDPAVGGCSVAGYYCRGFCRQLAVEFPYPNPLPEVSWRTMVARKRALQATYLRELMAVACHPRRLTQIGSDSFA